MLGFRRVEGRTEIIPLSIVHLFFVSSFFFFLSSFLLRCTLLRCDRNLRQIRLIPGASQMDYVISGDGSISVRNTTKVKGSNTSPNTCVPDITKRNLLHVAGRRRQQHETSRLCGSTTRRLER